MDTIQLQAGSLVYYDSLTAGLVPCRIQTVDQYDSELRILLTVTAKRGCYDRGHEIDAAPRWIMPRNVRRVRGKFGRVFVPPHKFTVTRVCGGTYGWPLRGTVDNPVCLPVCTQPDAKPPYPFCHTPNRCAGAAYCKHDPACNE